VALRSFFDLFSEIKKDLLDEFTPSTLKELDEGIEQLKAGLTGPLAALERLRSERLEVDTWDRWYNSLPDDIKGKINMYDFKRLGDSFKKIFKVEELD
jgi:hypothetical protein